MITCVKCDHADETPAEALGHLGLYHGFTGPSRGQVQAHETPTASPFGMDDQRGYQCGSSVEN